MVSEGTKLSLHISFLGDNKKSIVHIISTNYGDDYGIAIPVIVELIVFECTRIVAFSKPKPKGVDQKKKH